MTPVEETRFSSIITLDKKNRATHTDAESDFEVSGNEKTLLPKKAHFAMKISWSCHEKLKKRQANVVLW